jgi:hypothetical protein
MKGADMNEGTTEDVLGPHMSYSRPTRAQTGWGPFRWDGYMVIRGCHQKPLFTREILFEIVWAWWKPEPRSLLKLMRHTWHRSDEDRDLHTHPWPFIAFIAKGGYFEETPKNMKWKKQGSILFRWPAFSHAVRFLDEYKDGTCVSYVLTGPRLCNWGFWRGDTWIDWKTYGRSRICE